VCAGIAAALLPGIAPANTADQPWQLYTTAALAQVPVTPFPAIASDEEGNTGLRPVPSVVGIPVDQAVDRLATEGFQGTQVTVANGDYPPGFVVAQNPCAGCLAQGGSAVTLQVGNGRAAVRVPSVLGAVEEDARQTLSAAGFDARVIVQQEPPGPDSQPGRVWKQAPAAGVPAQPGSAVSVWISPQTSPITTNTEETTTTR